MRQICLLVAMLMMCSVSGRSSDNLREAAETEPTMDDNTNKVRRQETTVCGRRQILTSTLDEGEGGSNDDDYSDPLDKILGGSDVTYDPFPWQVNIYRYSQRICGGAIISEFWIVTAASCIYNRRRRGLKLVAGDHRLSQYNESQQRFLVQRRVLHPSYSGMSDDFDIALIKVKHKNGSGISFNNYVQPICLPVAGESLADNDNLTVLGMGNYISGTSTPSSETIPTHVLPVFNHTRCLNKFSPGRVTNRILCVRRFARNSDMCVLGIGGPATFQSGDTHILAGILIYDIYCRPPSKPAFLTNVLVLRDWIHDRINEFSTARQRVIPPRAD